MRDCNKCEYDQRCMQSIKPGPITYASRCTKYVPPKRMKAPILHHLVFSGKIAQLAEVLTSFNMQLVDTTHYPKFKLEWTDK